MQALYSYVTPRETEPCSREGTPIVVGLVNNMPDAALLSTERQFSELLYAGPHASAVHLKLFALPEIQRSEAGRSYVSQHYQDVGALWSSDLDGLIVTGTMPRTPSLADEPYWATMTKLVDWAEKRTVSTIWSCLAAHVAVLHSDGIDRQALDTKLSGVFGCTKAVDHPVLSDLATQWRVPHSRYNELPEEALASNGYQILSRSPDAGVDMFARQRNSLFLFLQGHPEYDAGALLREYRRDVGRFLARELDDYPEMPREYFDENAATEMVAFRQHALRKREIGLLASFPSATAIGDLPHSWRRPAVRLYANWLSYLVEHRSWGEMPADYARRFG